MQGIIPHFGKPYQLRLPSPGEESGIQEMIQEILLSYGFPTYEQHPKDKDFENLKTAYAHPQEVFYVLEDTKTGERMGCGGLKRISPDEAEIRKMYFKKQVRGQGLGSWLMGILMDLARRSGYKKVTLETHTQLPDSHKLYERFGFTRFEKKSTEWGCDLWYELNLDSYTPRYTRQPVKT